MRLWVGRLLLIVAATLAALVGAESVVRALPDSLLSQVLDTPDDSLWADPEWRSPPAHVYRDDPDIGYVHASSAIADVKVAEHPNRAFRFRTNSVGLRRDDDVVVPKPPGTFRVLVLGDSQTSGYTDNDETYPARLEALLQRRAGPARVEVLNAGVDGYGPQQAYLWYLKHGAALAPDLVIFAVYAGNDLDDLAHGVVDAAVIDEDAGLIGPLRAPWAWLSLRLHLVQHVSAPVRRALDREATLAVAAPEDQLVRVLRECHGCWLQSLKQAVRARIAPEPIERAQLRLERALRLVNALTAAEGGQFAVLLIPTKPQVEPDDEPGAIGRAGRLLELEPEDVEYDAVAYAEIRRAAERAGASVIDPLVALQAEARRTRLYYRRDWHLNPDGNRALASAIDQALGPAISTR